jgi:hypothetical protein
LREGKASKSRLRGQFDESFLAIRPRSVCISVSLNQPTPLSVRTLSKTDHIQPASRAEFPVGYACRLSRQRVSACDVHYRYAGNSVQPGTNNRSKLAHRPDHFWSTLKLSRTLEASWREDNRRMSNGEQVSRLAGRALKAKAAVDFGECPQRRIGAANLGGLHRGCTGNRRSCFHRLGSNRLNPLSCRRSGNEEKWAPLFPYS